MSHHHLPQWKVSPRLNADNDKLCGLSGEQELCLQADPATAKTHPSRAEVRVQKEMDRFQALRSPPGTGSYQKAPRPLSQSDVGGLGAGMQRHPSHRLTNSEPRGQRRLCRQHLGPGAARAHQLRGAWPRRLWPESPLLSALVGLGSPCWPPPPPPPPPHTA